MAAPAAGHIGDPEAQPCHDRKPRRRIRHDKGDPKRGKGRQDRHSAIVSVLQR
jgi:hypothetical protein